MCLVASSSTTKRYGPHHRASIVIGERTGLCDARIIVAIYRHLGEETSARSPQVRVHVNEPLHACPRTRRHIEPLCCSPVSSQIGRGHEKGHDTRGWTCSRWCSPPLLMALGSAGESRLTRPNRAQSLRCSTITGSHVWCWLCSSRSGSRRRRRTGASERQKMLARVVVVAPWRITAGAIALAPS